MSWNYRIIYHDLPPNDQNRWYGLHEVYYRGKQAEDWTDRPILVGESPEEIMAQIAQMQYDTCRYYGHPLSQRKLERPAWHRRLWRGIMGYFQSWKRWDETI
jgi:hypothetical protein